MCRFSIRDVLWLTVVMALVVGWWADRRKRDQEISDKIERISAEYQAMREQRFP
jgi:hypothetical protein